ARRHQDHWEVERQALDLREELEAIQTGQVKVREQNVRWSDPRKILERTLGRTDVLRIEPRLTEQPTQGLAESWLVVDNEQSSNRLPLPFSQPVSLHMRSSERTRTHSSDLDPLLERGNCTSQAPT